MEDSDILAMLGGFVVVFLIIGLVLYLLDAIARFKYLKVRGYENAWFAFIPIVNIWASVTTTYGSAEKIKFYGVEVPAIVIKLWSVVYYVATVIVTRLPVASGTIGFVLTLVNIAVILQIYRDMMERLDNPQDTVSAVVAVIINFISDIKLLGAAGKFQPGQLDYRTDERVLSSQN